MSKVTLCCDAGHLLVAALLREVRATGVHNFQSRGGFLCSGVLILSGKGLKKSLILRGVTGMACRRVFAKKHATAWVISHKRLNAIKRD
jgi:hypothetical protein